MVSYSESSDGIDKILTDDTCKEIYYDVEKILCNNSIGLFVKEDMMMNLLQKYNNHYLAYYYLGYYHDSAKNPDIAISCYKLSINANKNFIDSYLNIAIIYHKYGKISETKNFLAAAYAVDPNDLRVLNFLGALQYLDNNYYDAYSLYINILSKERVPSESLKNIYNNLGFSCSAIGKFKKALYYFNVGLNLKCYKNISDSEQQLIDCTKINTQILQNKLINYDYMYKIPNDIKNDYLEINSILGSVQNHQFEKKKNDKIIVGYVSGDLRQHVVASFLDCILKYFDRSCFSVICYANVTCEDHVSQIFKSYPGIEWFNISNFDVIKVYNLIKSHNVDILIDLAGHTNNNNIDVFAKKPAPIQITYLGYPNTTGLTTMDYRIADKYTDPETSTQWYSEKLIRMPRCFICYTPTIDLNIIPITYTRLYDVDARTNKNSIKFGIFNKIHKYNKYTYRVWNFIVNSISNSKVILKKDSKTYKREGDVCVSKLNLPSHKFEMIEYVPDAKQYLNMYNDIDICLDTFPYSGTTTSCDALMMGTPIVTLSIPNRHVSNVTSSLLINMGFPELIAHSLDEYINIAIRLANDPDKIMYYKQNIRNKFLELMNAQQFSKEFDQLLCDTYANDSRM